MTDEFTVHPYLDPKSGQSRKAYRFKGKVCPTVRLTSARARRLAAYELIADDLADAKQWLASAHDLLPKGVKPQAGKDRVRLAKEPAMFSTITALWSSSIAAYGRCYTDTKGRKVKLERTNLPAEYLDRHDQIMGYRHDLVAHAGVVAHEEAVIDLVLSPNQGERLWLVADYNRVTFNDDRADPVSFAQLIDQVTRQVHEKIKELRQDIKDKEVKPKGPDHWYRQASK